MANLPFDNRDTSIASNFKANYIGASGPAGSRLADGPAGDGAARPAWSALGVARAVGASRRAGSDVPRASGSLRANLLERAHAAPARAARRRHRGRFGWPRLSAQRRRPKPAARTRSSGRVVKMLGRAHDPRAPTRSIADRGVEAGWSSSLRSEER